MPGAFPEDARFAAGVREFNARNFYEAHEIWEDLWNDLVGQPKQTVQGLIQIAVGYHKLAIGSAGGARKLLERGLRLLRAAGVVADVVAAVEADLDLVRSRPSEAAAKVRPPKIESS